MPRLTVLNSEGDTTLTWDAANPEQVAEIRQTVADLKEAGYTFFLADNSPADEVAAGAGTLLARRLAAAEVAQVTDPAIPAETPRRGRRTATAPQAEVVAVRPQRGG
jgi:hypothetical protein